MCTVVSNCSHVSSIYRALIALILGAVLLFAKMWVMNPNFDVSNFKTFPTSVCDLGMDLLIPGLKIKYCISYYILACSRYPGYGHIVSVLRPSALGWRKVRNLWYLIFVELPFYNTYASYVVDNVIFGINIPDYPSRILYNRWNHVSRAIPFYISTSALRLLALRELLFTLTCPRAFGPR